MQQRIFFRALVKVKELPVCSFESHEHKHAFHFDQPQACQACHRLGPLVRHSCDEENIIVNVAWGGLFRHTSPRFFERLVLF